MRSVMNHNFSMVPSADIPRSAFNRSHGFKTTFDAGYLIPIFVDEAVPGDTFNVRANIFARLNTPIVPFMDNMFADTFFFAVPYRLVWNNWVKMNGEQVDPDDSTDYLVPQMESPASTGYAVGSLSDYMGLPTGVAELEHSSLWHRAYNLIWNEWFRDQNLQDSVVVDKDDGPDAPADYVLLRRGKRHDYFTSCLPWPQKGPAVPLPLGTSAPIKGFNTATGLIDDRIYLRNIPGVHGEMRALSTGAAPALGADVSTSWTNGDVLNWPAVTAPNGYNFADLSTATAATINSLREAFQLQKLYERDARGGTRYTEIIRSHFGVISPDARLQRPEYLGGGSSPINLTAVAQTSSTDGTTPQGNLAATGVFSASGHGFVRSFTEHCLLLGLLSVRADLNYQNTLNRMWSRRSRFDFYWPALSHIGEQAVLNKEIWAQGPAGDSNPRGADDDVFGYQERWAEYRYKPSQITGLFRSQAASSIDIWHLAQEFSDLPLLDDEFIQDDPPVDRVSAVPSQPHFKMDVYFKMSCARPMPAYSVPGLIDHF